MRVFIGVTDQNWHRFLAANEITGEVNFWKPSSSQRQVTALDPGDLFLFKSKFPHHRIVGGGTYSEFARLQVSKAWQLFGEGNGASSEQEFRRLLNSNRRSNPIGPGDDPIIGCLMLRDVFFFPEDEPVEPPPDWPKNVVQGIGYDLEKVGETPYFIDLIRHVEGGVQAHLSEPWHHDGPMFGNAKATKRRLGQQAFKAAVLDRYEGRCAITGSKIRPTLEAAHIHPVAHGGEHRLDNGLLLRSDVHTLFDGGYLGVSHDYRLLVSDRLTTDFDDGPGAYPFAGTTISLPPRVADRPSLATLQWHRDNVFK